MTIHRENHPNRNRINWSALSDLTQIFSWRFFAAIFAFEILLILLNITRTPSVTINRLLDVDTESNLWTWLSSAQLLLLSLTTLVAWKLDTDIGWKRTGWFLLAALFGYLSIDETATIHESFGAAATKQFQWTIWGEYYWMLVFAPFAFVGIVLLVHVVWQKLRMDKPAFLLGVAGILAWLGTLTLETLWFWFMGHRLDVTQTFRGLVLIEELCEMAGATLFWAAVVRWIRFRKRPTASLA